MEASVRATLESNATAKLQNLFDICKNMPINSA